MSEKCQSRHFARRKKTPSPEVLLVVICDHRHRIFGNANPRATRLRRRVGQRLGLVVSAAAGLFGQLDVPILSSALHFAPLAFLSAIIAGILVPWYFRLRRTA
jgi:hypothetical protein